MANKKIQSSCWKEIGIKDPKFKKIPEILKKIPNSNSFFNSLKQVPENKNIFRVEITYKLDLSNPKLNKEKFVGDVKFNEVLEFLSAMQSKDPEEDYKIIAQIIRTDNVIMKFAQKFRGILSEDGEGNVIYGGRDLAFMFSKKEMALNFLREMYFHPKNLSQKNIKILAIGFYGMNKKNKKYNTKIIYTWIYKKNKWIRKNLFS